MSWRAQWGRDQGTGYDSAPRTEQPDRDRRWASCTPSDLIMNPSNAWRTTVLRPPPMKSG